ncbi:glycoside hydrolase family 29 (alpha-L-fucosidase) [Coriobacterium glomerans PW2]|uniref:alpha-L-fucosidase n=1 Tax=Coriobacterium glomerans (strain ATCC 49209 / DSM 20642 / JCM 10262 / PW2) TaxID=700015 RepID=F2N8D8_CORGP|nr:glycoside hydrolase family 29 (alpha-L-fucosidase) [Coriobacterium glomerans PW2]
MYRFDRERYDERMKWFVNDRFGMFIHFGLYAIPARGEWVMSIEEMDETAYARYFDQFDPTAFDARAWARSARSAGVRYAVLTAKHHDGFCLYDTATTDFKSTCTHLGRDIVAEFLEAFRAEGIRVGLYYSLIDWHHPDFPQFGDRQAPLRRDSLRGANTHRVFSRYLDFMHEQVRELCENYGALDLLWFDFSYDELRGEAWRATDLMNMVRSLQPGVIVNNRLEVSGEGLGSLAACAPTAYHGDFVTPEQIIPPRGLVDAHGDPLVWEACLTLNDNWGYCATDLNYKSASLIIHKLVECVSKGGNMIVNVGPDATGRFPEPSMRILETVGSWLARNGESVYGCGPSQGGPIEPERPEWGRITRDGDTYFAHLYESALGPVPLLGFPPDRIAAMRRVADGSEVRQSESWTHSDYPDIAFADLGPLAELPDSIDTVIGVNVV